MMEDKDGTELPQPGLDEEPTDDTGGDHPTDGRGSVSVEEPTETSLNPDEDRTPGTDDEEPDDEEPDDDAVS